MTDQALFDPKILQDLDFDQKSRAKYEPNITPQNPGDMLQIRPLFKTDYDKGISTACFKKQILKLVYFPSLYILGNILSFYFYFTSIVYMFIDTSIF